MDSSLMDNKNGQFDWPFLFALRNTKASSQYLSPDIHKSLFKISFCDKTHWLNRIARVKVWPLREMQSHTRTPLSSTLFKDKAANLYHAASLIIASWSWLFEMETIGISNSLIDIWTQK